MPAAKKHASTRARRNKAATAATLTPVLVEDYESWTLAELRTEVDRRNEDGAELPRTGGKAVLAKALQDDDLQVPELPERVAGWHEQTRRWWEDAWSSPMSQEWHSTTDVHNMYVAAMHYDDMWNAESAVDRQKATGLFLKLESVLGLTPYDRRRLEWQIETAEDAKARGRQRRSGMPANGSKPKGSKRPDPRGLHAVS